MLVPVSQEEIVRRRKVAGQILEILSLEQRRIVIDYLEALQASEIYGNFTREVHIEGERVEFYKNYGYVMGLEMVATFISAPSKEPESLLVNQEIKEQFDNGPHVDYIDGEGE